MRRGWYDDTRAKRENEREGGVGRGGEERERERKPPPPSYRGGSCAGAPVNEVVG